MRFTIQDVTPSVSHTAAIIVQGYFTKGPGQSYALPTHKPILVLRDPPVRSINEQICLWVFFQIVTDRKIIPISIGRFVIS